MKKQPIKNELERTEYLFYKTAECSGGGERTSVTVVMNIKEGTTDVKVEHTISERFELKDYDQAVHLYECLTGGNGRRMYKPSDLAHWYNKDKYKTE